MAEAMTLKSIIDKLGNSGLSNLAVVEVSTPNANAATKVYTTAELTEEQERAIANVVSDVINSAGDELKEYKVKPDVVKAQLRDRLRKKSKVRTIQSFK